MTPSGDVLRFCREHQLCKISERLSIELDRGPRNEEFGSEEHEQDKGDWLADAFFSMPTSELGPYGAFVSEHTPLSTQHGVKGEEYRNVVVMFDDVEAAWSSYNFAKMLAPRTCGAPTDGQQTRSQKLAYVCFSRAKENLRILLFARNVEEVRQELIERRLFEERQIELVRL